MADRTVPYLDAGKAAFEELDTYMASFLTLGDYPPLVSTPIEMATGLTFEQFEVVGYASGQIVKAVHGSVDAWGVVTQAAAHSVGATNKVPVWWSGHFNIDALVWPASFDTDAKKLAAFEGAAAPVQIVLGKR